jgi:hypothetical protein
MASIISSVFGAKYSYARLIRQPNRFAANQLRFLLAALAYTLMQRLWELALKARHRTQRRRIASISVAPDYW